MNLNDLGRWGFLFVWESTLSLTKFFYVNLLLLFIKELQKFTKENWALKQLHRLVTDDKLNISMSNFMLEEILCTDLAENPRRVFDVVSRLTFRGTRFDSFKRSGIIEQTLEYIKNHEFPEDNTLKSEKDNFISKLLQNAKPWELDDASARFEKYREDR